MLNTKQLGFHISVLSILQQVVLIEISDRIQHHTDKEL